MFERTPHETTKVQKTSLKSQPNFVQPPFENKLKKRCYRDIKLCNETIDNTWTTWPGKSTYYS